MHLVQYIAHAGRTESKNNMVDFHPNLSLPPRRYCLSIDRCTARHRYSLGQGLGICLSERKTRVALVAMKTVALSMFVYKSSDGNVNAQESLE